MNNILSTGSHWWISVKLLYSLSKKLSRNVFLLCFPPTYAEFLLCNPNVLLRWPSWLYDLLQTLLVFFKWYWKNERNNGKNTGKASVLIFNRHKKVLCLKHNFQSFYNIPYNHSPAFGGIHDSSSGSSVFNFEKTWKLSRKSDENILQPTADSELHGL